MQKLKTSNLNLDFEFQQLLGSLKHMINIIMQIKDTRCYMAYYIGKDEYYHSKDRRRIIYLLGRMFKEGSESPGR
jgi:hypothetical protein